MTEKELRTDSNQYNVGTQMKQQIHEEYNCAVNHPVLMKAWKEGRAIDIVDEEKKNGEPCIILGSGPSLDHSIKFLKNWKGGLICSTSQALACIKYGIEPDYILVLDPFCRLDEIKGYDWSKTKTKLVVHPGAWPDLIAYWPNKILMYLQNNGRPDNIYDGIIRHMYSERDDGFRDAKFHLAIRTSFTIFACSPALELFLADKLGFGDCFLCGCDFAYNKHNGVLKERFTDYSYENDKWIPHLHKYEPNEELQKAEVTTNNGLKTHVIHLYYKKNFLSAWRLSGHQLYTTDKGAILDNEIPYVSIEKVIKTQNGKKLPRLSLYNINKRAERYLATAGLFIIESSGGLNFVETQNPMSDLVTYMTNMSRRFICKKCGTRFLSEQNITGNNCANPVCKGEGTIDQEIKTDIEKNMKRINNLLLNKKKTNVSHLEIHDKLKLVKKEESKEIQEPNNDIEKDN